MKKFIALLMGLTLVFSFTACGNTSPSNSSQNETSVDEQETSQSEASAEETFATENTESDASESELPSDLETEPENGKTLVVYYSATGNTEEAANYIATATNADVFELEPKDPYTDADLDWTDDNSRVVYEHDNPDARDIELVAATVSDWESYDTVFIGYPIWWGQAPKIIYTFLESYSFSGKTIVPFCTSGSSEIGSSVENLHDLVSEDVTWFSGTRLDSTMSKEALAEWVDTLDW